MFSRSINGFKQKRKKRIDCPLSSYSFTKDIDIWSLTLIISSQKINFSLRFLPPLPPLANAPPPLQIILYCLYVKIRNEIVFFIFALLYMNYYDSGIKLSFIIEINQLQTTLLYIQCVSKIARIWSSNY